MHQDEIPRRGSGHREASASITAALSTLPFPITKQEAIGRVGDWKVPVGGDRVPLSQMLEAMPKEDFTDPADAINAVDQHWGRMVANLSKAKSERAR